MTGPDAAARRGRSRPASTRRPSSRWAPGCSATPTPASTSPVTYGDDVLPPKGCGITLVPWPNRIRGGRYTFDGADAAARADRARQAATPSTASAAGRAGPRSGRPPTRSRCGLDLVPQKGYPFEIRGEVTYALHAEDGLMVTLSARNTGTGPRTVRGRVAPLPRHPRAPARRRDVHAAGARAAGRRRPAGAGRRAPARPAPTTSAAGAGCGEPASTTGSPGCGRSTAGAAAEVRTRSGGAPAVVRRGVRLPAGVHRGRARRRPAGRRDRADDVRAGRVQLRRRADRARAGRRVDRPAGASARSGRD